MFFKKGYEMTLNRVHDTVTIREGEEKLTLTVNGDAMHMVAGMNRTLQKLQAMNEETPEEEVRNTAEYYASVIFGKEQAAQLMAFYGDDPSCVISVCGQYFRDRLGDKIAKVQKKMKV